jgi:hypothetical protein
MTRANRRSELARYRQFVRSTLGNWLGRQERKMHPDFGLTDDDAAEVMDAIEQELLQPVRPLLMVTVSTRPMGGADDEQVEPGYCLGLRFCDANDVVKIERLLIKQVRDRYPTYKGMKPREIRRALVFTVWVVPTNPTRGGWPIWDGPTGYWY